MWLLPLVWAIRLQTRMSVEPVDVLQVDLTVSDVNYEQLATHPDLVNQTEQALTDFFKSKVCGGPAPEEGLPPAAEEAAAEENATAPALLTMGARVGNATDGNATDGNATDAAAAPAGPGCDVNVVVRLYGNPFHVHAEIPYSEDFEATFSDEGFPKEFSDFLLTVSPVLLYAPAPPIAELAHVEKKSVASVIPECEAHLPGLLKELSAAYTNRMLPWALDGACGSFMVSFSFSASHTPNDADRVFCEGQSKKLMREHFGDAHSSSWNVDKNFADWCVTVCERKHGKTAVCAHGGGDAGGDAEEAGAEEAGANATNASLVTARRTGLRLVN